MKNKETTQWCTKQSEKNNNNPTFYGKKSGKFNGEIP